MLPDERLDALRRRAVLTEPPATLTPADDADLVDWQWRLSTMGVPREYWGIPKTLDRHQRLAGWRGVPWCVVITGPVGCGKTWQAIAALESLGLASSWFQDVPLLAEELRADVGSNERGQAEPRFRLWKVKALLLDDLGSQRPTPFVQEQIELVLRYRHANRLPTIVTANTVCDAEGRDPGAPGIAGLDERIVSRLQAGIHAPMRGADWRTS